MELFEEIRREYEFGIGTIQGVARKLGRPPTAGARGVERCGAGHEVTGCHEHGHGSSRWRLHRRDPGGGPSGATEAAAHGASDLRAAADGATGRAGRGVDGARVRRRAGRRAGPGGREVCVPQTYPWGSEAQVDWYEAVAILGDERVKLQVFSLRSMASGAAFHRAYRAPPSRRFSKAHEVAFRYFGGVFRRCGTTI